MFAAVACVSIAKIHNRKGRRADLGFRLARMELMLVAQGILSLGLLLWLAGAVVVVAASAWPWGSTSSLQKTIAVAFGRVFTKGLFITVPVSQLVILGGLTALGLALIDPAPESVVHNLFLAVVCAMMGPLNLLYVYLKHPEVRTWLRERS